MSCILSIETSTNVCSVAVSEDGVCIFELQDHSGPNHAERLGTFVDEALSFADSHESDLFLFECKNQRNHLIWTWLER